MTIRFRTVAPVLVAALAAFALAAEDTFVLKHAPKAGDVVKLKLKADFDFQGQQGTVTGITTTKITKVEANGDFTSESTQTESKVSVGGQDMAQPDQPATVTVYKANGEIVSITAPEANDTAYRFSNLIGMRFPDKPLKVGDTWDVEIKADAKTGTAPAKATYKVEALEKVGSYDTIRVKGSYKETAGDAPASGESTTWLNAKDGSVVKQEGTYVNAPIPSVGPINMKTSSTRID